MANSEQYNKRIYSFKDMHRFIEEAVRTMRYMIKGKRKGMINNSFMERIMLAVTEVNGCEMCSYFHTKEALKNGMSNDEINQMLAGTIENVPEEESVAIFFAQHYAETGGNPSRDAWFRVVNEYGREKSMAILGAIRGIMVGNTHGIAFGALKSRFQGHPTGKTSLGYELLVGIGTIPLVPIAIVTSLYKEYKSKPLIVYST